MLFDRLGDIAYESVLLATVVTAGQWDLVHAHQALPDGAVASAWPRTCASRTWSPSTAPTCTSTSAWAAREKRAKSVLAAADGVMADSSAVAGLLAGVVAAEKLTVVLNGTTGLARPSS